MASQSKEKTWHSFLWPLGIALAFIGWGLFIFYAVGDKEPPEWFYGSIQDVPGQSQYSTSSSPKSLPISPDRRGQVERQHVDGGKWPEFMPGEISR